MSWHNCVDSTDKVKACRSFEGGASRNALCPLLRLWHCCSVLLDSKQRNDKLTFVCGGGGHRIGHCCGRRCRPTQPLVIVSCRITNQSTTNRRNSLAQNNKRPTHSRHARNWRPTDRPSIDCSAVVVLASSATWYTGVVRWIREL